MYHGQLHTFTIVNNTMINLRLQIPFWYDFMCNIMILESTLGIYSRVELLGHIVVLLLFFFFRNPCIIFCNCCMNWHSHLKYMSMSSFYPLYLCHLGFLMMFILSRVRGYVQEDLTRTSLVINETKHFFKYLFYILRFLFSFGLFLYSVFFILYFSFLCIFDGQLCQI